MLLFSLLIAGIFAGNPNNRPFAKKVKHLKAAAPSLIKMYFVDAIPLASNPAHNDGTIKKLEARKRVGERLTKKLLTVTDVYDIAEKANCITAKAGARGSLERFVNGDFKMAARQILKNYLRIRDFIDLSASKQCKRLYNKVTRKVRRFDGNLRDKYCDKVYREEWCDKEYKYTLDERVENNKKQ